MGGGFFANPSAASAKESIPEFSKTRPLRELSYVRVYGHVRSFQGVRNVVAFKVFQTKDFNEITCHILETVYARMLHAKSRNPGGHSQALAKGGMTYMDSSSAAPASIGGLTVLQSQVLASVRAYPDERGISVSQIREKLRGVPEKQIRDDLDFLSAEGHVYSTVDDDHFKATEA
uniref:RPA_C domain-containing protein n=1 Tax=Mesocestoides corti TaxID=53468 RepID=A0A5K3EI49_MESCO